MTTSLNLFVAIQIRQIAQALNLLAAGQPCGRQARDGRRHIVAQHQQIIVAVKKAKIPLSAAVTKGIHIFKIRGFNLVIAPFVKHIHNGIFDTPAAFHLAGQNILGAIGDLINLI